MRKELVEATAYLQGRDEIARLIKERARCQKLEGFWLERGDALKLLDLLERHDARVLGGEVAIERDGELELAGDWQCESQVRKETIERSKEFVEGYLSADAWFHIVWKDAIGRYEDLMRRHRPRKKRGR